MTTESSSTLCTSSQELYAEAFSFISHEREDVQKMSIHGLASQSKDNPELVTFLISKPHGHKSMDLVLQHLHIGSAKILGDLLTLLINCSIDARCAELIVQKKVIRKAMRLLDSLTHSSVSLLPSDTFMRSLQELTLMLLNNLTASYVIAVDEFLQKEDEDMRGFYLAKLQSFYTTVMEESEAKEKKEDDDDKEEKNKKQEMKEGEEEEEEDPYELSSTCGKKPDKRITPSAAVTKDPKGGGKETTSKSLAALQANRDLARWMLRIVLNLSRCVDGQEQILSDERWQEILQHSLSSPLPSHRILAAQVFRNCACGSHPFFSMVVKGGGLLRAVQRLTDCSHPTKTLETIPEIAQCLAEFVSSMLESEEGVAQLESVNAKKLFAAVVARSKKNKSGALDMECRVEEIDDEENDKVAEQEEQQGENASSLFSSRATEGTAILSPALSPEVAEYIEKQILCHLDDILDAYLSPGSDELD